MKIRIASPGWATFSGALGQLQFKNGVSVREATPVEIRRIGTSLKIVNAEDGDQVGPAATIVATNSKIMPVGEKMKTSVEAAADAEAERERLAKEAAERKAADAAAHAEAMAKAEAAKAEELVIYSRQELEAIGANDGIAGLREIATPLGVKGRGIAELVSEILAAQSKKVAG